MSDPGAPEEERHRAGWCALVLWVGACSLAACGRAGYAVEDTGPTTTPDASGLDAHGLDAAPLDAATSLDASTGEPDVPLPFDAPFLLPDAPLPDAVLAEPDAVVVLDAPAPRTCVVSADCPIATTCLSGLCRDILFKDDFEDGVIAPEWSLMRFEFEESGGMLRSLATTRPGFAYGHSANGRSAVAALGIGSTWTDVHVEWTQQAFASVPIVDGGLPACQHTPNFGFRVASYTESWNDPSSTYYGFAIDQGCDGPIGPPGTFGLSVTYDYFIPGFGWSPASNGTSYAITNGTITPIADAPVRFVFEAVGAHYTLEADGVPIFDVTDVDHGAGEAPIPAGGVMFSAAWEQMFAIDDVRVVDLSHFIY